MRSRLNGYRARPGCHEQTIRIDRRRPSTRNDRPAKGFIRCMVRSYNCAKLKRVSDVQGFTSAGHCYSCNPLDFPRNINCCCVALCRGRLRTVYAVVCVRHDDIIVRRSRCRCRCCIRSACRPCNQAASAIAVRCVAVPLIAQRSAVMSLVLYNTGLLRLLLDCLLWCFSLCCDTIGSSAFHRRSPSLLHPI